MSRFVPPRPNGRDRIARPAASTDGVMMPPRSPAQEAIDHVLSDPTLSQELRRRLPSGGGGGGGSRKFNGGMWTAQKDGPCGKPIGWIIDDAGFLKQKECGALIPEGTQCWRQGWRFYGQGCHPKGLVILPRVFANEIHSSSEIASNLPDRRKMLEIAERLWNQDVAAGRLESPWGTPEREAEQQKIVDGIREALMMVRRGFVIPEKEAKARGMSPLSVVQVGSAPAVTQPIMIQDAMPQKKRRKKAASQVPS